MPIPQAVMDGLDNLQGKKDKTEASADKKDQTAAAVQTAEFADAAAEVVLTQDTSELNAQRVIVDAMIDAYYTPRGQIPQATA